MEEKKFRYADLRAEAAAWKIRIRPVAVGCRGLIARSSVSLPGETRVQGQFE